MVKFACKKIRIDEIVKCGFGISKSEFIIIEILLKNIGMVFTTKDILKHTKLNITTIQACVKSLTDKKIITKEQKNLREGGYTYLYSIKDRDELLKKILKNLKEWERLAEKEIEAWIKDPLLNSIYKGKYRI